MKKLTVHIAPFDTVDVVADEMEYDTNEDYVCLKHGGKVAGLYRWSQIVGVSEDAEKQGGNEDE